MKPWIAINCDYGVTEMGRERYLLNASYADAVLAAGGIPVLLPILEDAADLESFLSRVDGVLLTGGADFDPCHYGGLPHPAVNPLHRRRQNFDLALARALEPRPTPALGVCCGFQLLAIVAGGTLFEDIPTQVFDSIPHKGDGGRDVDHPVRTTRGSLLARILGEEALANSHHHQAVRDPGRLAVTATAPDGVLEGLEDPRRPFRVAVQWHPERILDRPAGGRLLSALVDAAREGRNS
jgi:putative glutamine amidotransferase